jgi:hypothetical protein
MKLIKRKILLRDGDNLGEIFKTIIPEDIDLVDITIMIEEVCPCCEGSNEFYLVYEEKVDE